MPRRDLPVPSVAAEAARRAAIEAWLAAYPESTTRSLAEAWGYRSNQTVFAELHRAGYAWTDGRWRKDDG